MRHVIVRYKVKPGQAELNEQLVKAVYEELHEAKPAGFRYATFRLDDGLSFTHISFAEGDDNPLTANKAFGKFADNIADRCEIPPQVTEMHVVGNYQLVD
jgi:hypothetical protein